MCIQKQFFKVSAGAAALTMVDGILAHAAPWSNLVRESEESGRPPARHIVQEERRSIPNEAAGARGGGSFNLLQERGIASEKQLRNWSELNVKPYQAQEVPAYADYFDERHLKWKQRSSPINSRVIPTIWTSGVS